MFALPIANCQLASQELHVRQITVSQNTSTCTASQGKAMAEGKFPPAFPLRHQKKDLGLAEHLAQETLQPLSIAKTVHKLYTQVHYLVGLVRSVPVA